MNILFFWTAHCMFQPCNTDVQLNQVKDIVDELFNKCSGYIDSLKKIQHEQIKDSIEVLERFRNKSKKTGIGLDPTAQLILPIEQPGKETIFVNDFQTEETKEESMQFLLSDLQNKCQVLYNYFTAGLENEKLPIELSEEKEQFKKCFGYLIFALNMTQEQEIQTY